MMRNIVHDTTGRLRATSLLRRMTLRQADVLEYYGAPWTACGRQGLRPDAGRRGAPIRTAERGGICALAVSFAKAEAMELVPKHLPRAEPGV